MVAKKESSGFPLIVPLIALVALGTLVSIQPPAPVPVPAAEMGVGELPPEQVGVREIHFVVNRSNCRQMAKRFREDGRNVKLVDTLRNPYGSGGFQLRFVCVFEGSDAQPGFFSRDKRYEAQHEWHNP